MAEFQAEPLLGCRVLVAEDDIILALDMKRLLENAGADVFGPVNTVVAAADLAGTAPLTCAVLDVNLGSHLIFPAAHILRERDIRTIFCTGYGDLQGLRADWPEAQVLPKPIQPRDLIQAVSPRLAVKQPGAK